MTGPIALHGGGEFLPGDEPFLREILGLAARATGSGPVRAVVVPTAAARGRPAIAGANGVEALRRVAAATDLELRAEVVPVVDAGSAADAGHASALRAATLIHLPGGDPDLIPSLYPGTAAWAAIRAAHRDGAVLAGASAGAMALAAWTWTGDRVGAGLGLVPGVLVLPHADAASWPRALERHGRLRPASTAVLGIGERTGVLIPGAGSGEGPAEARAHGLESWRVIGPGEARWLAPDRTDPADTVVVAGGGELMPWGLADATPST